MDVRSAFLDQPIEVAELRQRLAETICRGGEYPQLLVRFGFGERARPQARRTVDAVSEIG